MQRATGGQLCGKVLLARLATAASVQHDAWLKEQLQEPGFAAEYLTAAAQDAQPAVYLAALRKVDLSRGMAQVAARRRHSARKPVARLGGAWQFALEYLVRNSAGD